ncbi:hypothetical protein H696_05124 [Fonticula alba]|uniref:Anaphase-promoting complex subunit 4 WD40 domain-containing protein n=1 Tax=Fonticula alba TaxID=691883 RepID=A0A058Z1Q3_FONAL|nr:hypothetical protein H696_05124 [Fonticula alba]KCV68195.1 hypothetical protein H696_05124 [Fonticula alba]|eukprot:XP_009497249.1 hypothetical protein H696_05124 [Fonticula alba]
MSNHKKKALRALSRANKATQGSGPSQVRVGAAAPLTSKAIAAAAETAAAVEAEVALSSVVKVSPVVRNSTDREPGVLRVIVSCYERTIFALDATLPLPLLDEHDPLRKNKSNALNPTQQIADSMDAQIQRILSKGKSDTISRADGTTVTMKPRFVTAAHVGSVQALAVSHNWVASGSVDEIVKLYHARRCVELGSLHKHEGSITALAFCGVRAEHLISGGDDGQIILWRSKDWLPLKVMKGHARGAIRGIAVHPSNQLAISIGRDNSSKSRMGHGEIGKTISSMRLWDLQIGKCAFRKTLPFDAISVQWSPDGLLYAVVFDRLVQVTSVTTGKNVCVYTPPSRSHCAAFVPCQDLDTQEERYILAVGLENGSLVLVNVHDGPVSAPEGGEDEDADAKPFAGHVLATIAAHTNRIKDLACQDGYLATTSSDGTVCLWDMHPLVKWASAPGVDLTLEIQEANHPQCVGRYHSGMRNICIRMIRVQ